MQTKIKYRGSTCHLHHTHFAAGSVWCMGGWEICCAHILGCTLTPPQWLASCSHTISVVDCGQEIPQLRLPGRDDRPVAVPQERLCPGRVHQHLCRWLRDRAGLCWRCQAPQPILSTATLATSPRHCCRTQLLPKDSSSQTPLHFALGHVFNGQATLCWHHSNSSLPS